ncbi:MULTISPECIES: Rieske (2Fe-2S) protein [Actinomadura]|uniref:Rieske (2Fe-2S) protein n=1 Tax=Actinomadura yumaensis TaxID=111807 RepID=A0ABW2CLA4_9ACTN|nr:Rieske (2Fe-2S) protein [Actinomadura sp. J1-007]
MPVSENGTAQEVAAARVLVGSASDFREGDRKLVQVAGRTVGVFRVEGRFYAYENTCLHQGGPVCEGRYFPKMTAVVTGDGRVLGEKYDESEPHLVCPWHGWEFDLRTGEFCGDRSKKLRSYTVETEGDEVYVA